MSSVYILTSANHNRKQSRNQQSTGLHDYSSFIWFLSKTSWRTINWMIWLVGIIWSRDLESNREEEQFMRINLSSWINKNECHGQTKSDTTISDAIFLVEKFKFWISYNEMNFIRLNGKCTEFLVPENEKRRFSGILMINLSSWMHKKNAADRGHTDRTDARTESAIIVTSASGPCF